MREIVERNAGYPSELLAVVVVAFRRRPLSTGGCLVRCNCMDWCSSKCIQIGRNLSTDLSRKAFVGRI